LVAARPRQVDQLIPSGADIIGMVMMPTLVLTLNVVCGTTAAISLTRPYADQVLASTVPTASSHVAQS